MAQKKDDDVIVSITEQDAERVLPTHGSVPAVGRWPSGPQPLTGKPWIERGLDAYDAALCLTPVALMTQAVLCIVAAHLDSGWTGFWVDGVSNLTLQLIRVNSQLTTAFTIIFVLIFTTFLKRYALWRVQTGETVARLEQYQASSSLPGTLKAILSLRSYNAVSCALLVAWSFYYVGSQASSREYKYQASKPYKHGKFSIAYQSGAATSVFEPSIFPSLPAYNVSVISRVFDQQCLSFLGGGSDYLGNAILPWIDATLTGWQEFRVQENTFYASCAGIVFQAEPFYDPKSDDSSDSSTLIGDFHFNSSYLQLDCTAPSLADVKNFPKGVLESTSYTINITSTDESSGIYLEVWQRYNGTAVNSNCEIWTQPVEIKGHCDGSSCQVSQAKARPYDWQAEVFQNGAFASNFLEELVANQRSWLEIYTNWVDLESYVEYGGSLISYLNAVDVVSDVQSDWAEYYTSRLQQSFNTWYFGSQGLQNPETWSEPWISDLEMYNIIVGKQESDIFDRSIFKGAVYEPAYRLNVGWVIADLMSNTILLAAAIASFWLRKHTLAPDIFGYVSSLTRDNPNVPLPDGGTALSGWDRARLLRDVRVRIAATGSDEVGRITLARADAPPVEMRALERNMQYA